jgi:hypothetical protein
VNARPVAFVLLALACVWVSGLVVSEVSRSALPAVLVPLVSCALIGTYSSVSVRYPDVLVGIVVGFFAVLAVATGVAGALGWELGLGLLTGMPWLLVGYDARPEARLGLRFVALGVAVTIGLGLLAARSYLAMPGGSASARTVLGAVYTVFAVQSNVLVDLISGTALPSLPLVEFFDPVYAGLLAAGLLGLCLVSVRPQTGTGRWLPLSIPFRDEPADVRTLPTAYGFSGRQRAVFSERTVPEPPLTAWPPGLVSVLGGAVGAGVFLLIAYAEPFRALLALVVALLGVAAVAVLLTEFPGILRPRPGSGRRGRRLFVRASTPRVTRELLTSPSLPVNEPPSDPPPSGR